MGYLAFGFGQEARSGVGIGTLYEIQTLFMGLTYETERAGKIVVRDCHDRLKTIWLASDGM